MRPASLSQEVYRKKNDTKNKPLLTKEVISAVHMKSVSPLHIHHGVVLFHQGRVGILRKRSRFIFLLEKVCDWLRTSGGKIIGDAGIS